MSGEPSEIEVRPDDEAEPYVFDAEIVDEEDIPEQPRRWIDATVLRTSTTHLVTTLGASGAAARAGRAGRVTARATWVVGQGGVSWARRAASAATHGHLREQVRLARLGGDSVALAEWLERHQKVKDARLQRLLAMPKAMLSALVVAGVAVAVVGALLFVGGVIVQLAPDGATWAGWWDGVGAVLDVLGTLLRVVVLAALAVSVPLAVWLAWREGKRVADPPFWLLTPTERAQVDAEITPSKVVLALRNLGLAELRKAIKEADDGGASMLGPITLAGRGTQVDVLLPSGVEPDEVRKRQPKLAGNLDRHRHELHITIPPAARSVRLWAAHPGALDEPIGPSPLVIDPDLKANYRTGRAPWGEDLRGGARGLSVYQRHLLVTGVSNQGKTFALRAVALWLALDLKPRFHIGDLKGAGDWGMFDGLADVLIEGPTDEHVALVVEMVEAAVAEMERRLVEGGTWDPLIVIVDEAQVAFMCPAKDAQGRPYGGTKASSRYFMAARKLQNQGRAVDVLLWQGTQNPTDQNLPVLVREGAHIRASLYVGTESQSKMALGDAAFAGGAAPHALRKDIDRGTLVVHGGVDLAPGESSMTIRTHFIDDQPAAEIAERAKARRRKAGRAANGAPAPEPVDHLANIKEALGAESRVRTMVLLERLAAQAPGTYEPWSAADLRAELLQHGVPVAKSDGQRVVRAEDVHAALRARPDVMP